MTLIIPSMITSSSDFCFALICCSRCLFACCVLALLLSLFPSSYLEPILPRKRRPMSPKITSKKHSQNSNNNDIIRHQAQSHADQKASYRNFCQSNGENIASNKVAQQNKKNIRQSNTERTISTASSQSTYQTKLQLSPAVTKRQAPVGKNSQISPNVNGRALNHQPKLKRSHHVEKRPIRHEGNISVSRIVYDEHAGKRQRHVTSSSQESNTTALTAHVMTSKQADILNNNRPAVYKLDSSHFNLMSFDNIKLPKYPVNITLNESNATPRAVHPITAPLPNVTINGDISPALLDTSKHNHHTNDVTDARSKLSPDVARVSTDLS